MISKITDALDIEVMSNGTEPLPLSQMFRQIQPHLFTQHVGVSRVRESEGEADAILFEHFFARYADEEDVRDLDA